MPQALTLVLFPHGALCLEETTGTPALDAGVSGRIKEAFARGAGYGLLALGLVTDTPLPPDLAFWRNFACRFIAARCQADADETAAPSIDDWNGFADEAPPMRGGEYLGASVLAELWTSLGAALESELAASGLDLEAYLRGDYQDESASRRSSPARTGATRFASTPSARPSSRCPTGAPGTMRRISSPSPRPRSFSFADGPLDLAKTARRSTCLKRVPEKPMALDREDWGAGRHL